MINFLVSLPGADLPSWAGTIFAGWQLLGWGEEGGGDVIYLVFIPALVCVVSVRGCTLALRIFPSQHFFVDTFSPALGWGAALLHCSAHCHDGSMRPAPQLSRCRAAAGLLQILIPSCQIYGARTWCQFVVE